jgi:uncharacterized membrane protein (UPF0127 family)
MLADKVHVCESKLPNPPYGFWGFMLTKELAPDGGIMLVGDAESKVNASIHMMFMRYDITVLWLDKDKVLVDKVLAKKWMMYYAPKTPAQYILEIHPDRFDDFAVGDKLEIL